MNIDAFVVSWPRGGQRHLLLYAFGRSLLSRGRMCVWEGGGWVWAHACRCWCGVVVVWGDGRATRRGKLDGRGRKCEGRAEAHERGAESAGLGGPGGGVAGGALGDGHAFLFV